MSSSSNATPEPLDPNFRLELQGFEGPLDLLLHLCQKHELDVLDLPIAFVTESYLSYIRLMEKLDLDIASEYLVMAATLAHIKSKMLLPADPAAQQDDVDPEDEVDPRQELIRRLLEYQKYKAAGEELGARGVQGRDVFLRGMEAPEASGPPPLAGMGLFKLLDAFQAVLKRAKQDLAFEITAEGVTIQDRMTQLAERLRVKRRCTFDELFVDVKSVYDVVVTFLAILEMAKRRLARVYQSDPLAPIHLEYRVLDADEAAEGGPDSEGAAAQTYDEPAPVAAQEVVALIDELDAAPEESAAVPDEESTVPSFDVFETTAVVDEATEPAVDVLDTSAPSDESEEPLDPSAPIDESEEPPVEPASSIDESETLPEERETEPGIALETPIEPPTEGALETPLAPEVDESLEAPITPDEAPLDLGDALAQDPRPAEAGEPEEPDETEPES